MTVKSYRQVVDEDDSVTNSETYEPELKPEQIDVKDATVDWFPTDGQECAR